MKSYSNKKHVEKLKGIYHAFACGPKTMLVDVYVFGLHQTLGVGGGECEHSLAHMLPACFGQFLVRIRRRPLVFARVQFFVPKM